VLIPSENKNVQRKKKLKEKITAQRIENCWKNKKLGMTHWVHKLDRSVIASFDNFWKLFETATTTPN
jgi:hypothetical protein